MNEGFLAAKLQDLTKDHDLQASYVIGLDGRVIGTVQQRFMRTMPVPLPKASELAEAARGVIEIDTPDDRFVTALVPMHSLNAFLLLVRTVDPRVFGYYKRAKSAAATYKTLEASASACSSSSRRSTARWRW